MIAVISSKPTKSTKTLDNVARMLSTKADKLLTLILRVQRLHDTQCAPLRLVLLRAISLLPVQPSFSALMLYLQHVNVGESCAMGHNAAFVTIYLIA